MKFICAKSVFFIAILVSGFFAWQCSYVRQAQNAMLNLQRCQFKLQNISGFHIAGVDFSDKSSLGDFSLLGDGGRLAGAFASHSLPADFTVNVQATNPNDGSGNTPNINATLVSLPWTLLIDDKPTISGDIEQKIVIPGKGQSTVIPFPMHLDLYQFFGDKSYEDMVNLALAIGGKQGSAARLVLRGTPHISTPIGDISYPQPIDIVSKEYRN